ncbi:tetratricopeptide repeat protein [Archangium gephyra]|uniref:tetratricopeptide repeat protein n=1 Tax=Archangium gephyra TaxID=48 RepID=UPI003B7D71AA
MTAPVAASPVAPAPAAAAAQPGREQFFKLLTETEVYVKYGLHEKALKHLRKIFAVDPENLDAHEKAYQIYVASGNVAQASDQLLNVLRLCTRRAEVQRAQPYLATIFQQNPGHPELPAFLAVLRPDDTASALAGSQVEWVGEDTIFVDSNDEGLVLADEPLDALEHPPDDEPTRVSAPVAPESPEAPLVPLDPPHVRRTALEAELTGILQREHRLVLLAPEEGGARSLARRLAEPYGERVTWLAPPNLPDCTEADYCRALAGAASVTSFDALVEHLRERAGVLGREHLLVLRYAWGPLGHLDTLGKHLRRLMEEPSKVEFHLLVAGGERAAWLLHNVPKFSVYKDAPRREVPDFTVDEVRQLLDGVRLDGTRWAGEVHEATGGHLGLLKEVLLGAGALDRESVTARLARSPSVRGALQDRLREDERNGYTDKRSCRFVLEELLAGRPVEALEPLDHRIEHPEVRLYFSGLVRSDAEGKTVLRCQAVEARRQGRAGAQGRAAVMKTGPALPSGAPTIPFTRSRLRVACAFVLHHS